MENCVDIISYLGKNLIEIKQPGSIRELRSSKAIWKIEMSESEAIELHTQLGEALNIK